MNYTLFRRSNGPRNRCSYSEHTKRVAGQREKAKRFFGVHADIDDFACRHGTVLFLARKRRYRCVRNAIGVLGRGPVTEFVLES